MKKAPQDRLVRQAFNELQALTTRLGTCRMDEYPQVNAEFWQAKSNLKALQKQQEVAK